MTEAQLDAHSDLDAPIARLLSVTKKRPLTQSEFLRLMALLLTQRVIANGMAQLQFEERHGGWGRSHALRAELQERETG